MTFQQLILIFIVICFRAILEEAATFINIILSPNRYLLKIILRNCNAFKINTQYDTFREYYNRTGLRVIVIP